RSTHVRVKLTRDGEGRAAWEKELDLVADKPETIAFPDRAEPRGLRTYEASIEAQGDLEPRNDRGGCAVLVRGGPEAAVIEASGEGEAIAAALDAQGFRVKRVPAPHAPTLKELATVDLVVLAGTSLVGPEALPRERAHDLEQFVREGGGLLALGGSGSYS